MLHIDFEGVTKRLFVAAGKMRPADLARALDVTPQFIHKLRNGEKLSFKIDRIFLAFDDLTALWVLTDEHYVKKHDYDELQKENTALKSRLISEIKSVVSEEIKNELGKKNKPSHCPGGAGVHSK